MTCFCEFPPVSHFFFILRFFVLRSLGFADRAELLRMKLEATQVFGFMWEGLQQKGWAPMWEWSVIMSRKVVIIMIILLLQNFEPNYQLTFALIVMFAYNLLHGKLKKS